MAFIANDLNKVPIIKDNVIYTPIGEECVIYPSYEDEKDLPYIITLNDVGTFIFNLINGKNTIKDILNEILENYDITEDIAIYDLYSLINDLDEGKIIIWKK